MKPNLTRRDLLRAGALSAMAAVPNAGSAATGSSEWLPPGPQGGNRTHRRA